MHMSYNEEELDKLREGIDLNKTVEELNTEKKAEEIDYKGSLKKKLHFHFYHLYLLM
jgi:nitrate reductase NapD